MQYYPYLLSFLFILSLYPLFFNSMKFSSLLSFLSMHVYIKSSGFIKGKGPRSLKNSFCHIKGKVSIWVTIHLRLDPQRFTCLALKCVTLDICEAWNVVVYITQSITSPQIGCFHHSFPAVSCYCSCHVRIYTRCCCGFFCSRVVRMCIYDAFRSEFVLDLSSPYGSCSLNQKIWCQLSSCLV